MSVAIGVGCRTGCAAEAIEAVVRRALDHTPDPAPLGLFTIADKQGDAGLTEAARRLGLDLVFLPRAALRDQAPLVLTRSPGSERAFDVPSVAEASALAGAGRGAVLLVPRIAQNGATCAIAGRPGGLGIVRNDAANAVAGLPEGPLTVQHDAVSGQFEGPRIVKHAATRAIGGPRERRA